MEHAVPEPGDAGQREERPVARRERRQHGRARLEREPAQQHRPGPEAVHEEAGRRLGEARGRVEDRQHEAEGGEPTPTRPRRAGRAAPGRAAGNGSRRRRADEGDDRRVAAERRRARSHDRARTGDQSSGGGGPPRAGALRRPRPRGRRRSPRASAPRPGARPAASPREPARQVGGGLAGEVERVHERHPVEDRVGRLAAEVRQPLEGPGIGRPGGDGHLGREQEIVALEGRADALGEGRAGQQRPVVLDRAQLPGVEDHPHQGRLEPVRPRQHSVVVPARPGRPSR